MTENDEARGILYVNEIWDSKRGGGKFVTLHCLFSVAYEIVFQKDFFFLNALSKFSLSMEFC